MGAISGLAPVAHYDRRAAAALETMARYVTGFLASDHPDLGRSGPVCPFVPLAVEEDLIHLTASSVADQGGAGLIVSAMEVLRDLVERAHAQGGRHRAVVAVFPRLAEPDGAALIERIQKALKPSFVRKGLMIGQFYPGCAAPGLWNAAFRPLQAPVISLAIRSMTIADAPFMLESDDYVAAYLDRFGPPGSERIAKAAASWRGGAAACPEAGVDR